jgi:hypothetical protein
MRASPRICCVRLKIANKPLGRACIIIKSCHNCAGGLPRLESGAR